MIKFRSEDRYKTSDGKIVYTLTNKEEMPVTRILNKKAIIEGREYRVKAIERFGINLGDDYLHKNEKIGLMVKETRREEVMSGEKIRTTIYLNKELHKASKILSIEEGKSLSKVIEDYLKDRTGHGKRRGEEPKIIEPQITESKKMDAKRMVVNITKELEKQCEVPGCRCKG